MVLKFLSSLTLACTVAGCGTQLPEFTSPRVLPMDALVGAIHCELADAVRQQAEKPGRGFLKSWQGAYTVTLKGDEAGTLAADANKLPIGFGAGSSVAIVAGADIKGAANRTAILKFNLNVADIKRSDPPCSEGSPDGTHPFLRGRMGFREWLDTAIEAGLADKTIRNHPDKLTSIGHTFEFAVTSTAALNPVFTIVPKPVTLNPSVSVSREEDNSVDVVLAKPAAKASGPTIVVKVLTPEQLAQIAKEQKQRDDAKQKLDKAEAFLSSPDGRRTAGLEALIDSKQAALTELGVAVPKDVFGLEPESALPSERKNPQTLNQASSAIISLKQLTGQLAGDKDYATYLTSKRDKTDLPAVVTAQQTKIDNIKADPQGLRATRAPGGVASVEDNPNIVNTSLQLTLERVLGNTRVPGF